MDAWIGRRSTRVSPRRFFARSALRIDSAALCGPVVGGCEGLCQSYPFASLQKVTAPPAKLYLRRRSAAQLSQEKVSFGVLKCSERGTAGGVT